VESQKLLLDTDVIVNWLIQEVETASSKKLWEAPLKIIKLIEEKDVIGIISLTTLMEVRYLLRRKKSYAAQQVEEDISKLTTLFEVVIPDEINLLNANTLQAEHSLDPFDAIQLAVSIGLKPIALISRDKEFIKISKQFITTFHPEEFLSTIK
jgi:predicted nucleic acid-binding protein